MGLLGFTFALDQDQEEGSRIFSYSDAQWAAVVALVGRPPTRELKRRTDIERAASRVIQGNYQPSPTNSELVERWQRVARATEELRSELNTVLELDGEDEVFDRMCTYLLKQADIRTGVYRTQKSRRRTANDPELTALVGQILDLWTECGGSLRFSSGDEKGAKGPLIRFLKTTLAPIEATGLSPLGRSQLAYLIRKKREPLRRPRLSGTDDFT